MLLVDVDAALPVLLVRPSEAASVPSSSPLAVEVEELEAASAPADGVTFMWPAPEHIGEAREEDAVASPMSEIPAEEAEAFASYVSLADDQAPTEVDAETIPVDLDDLATDALPVPELAMELEAEPVPAATEPEIAPELEGPLESVPEVAGAIVWQPEADVAEPTPAVDNGAARRFGRRRRAVRASDGVIGRRVPRDPS